MNRTKDSKFLMQISVEWCFVFFIHRHMDTQMHLAKTKELSINYLNQFKFLYIYPFYPESRVQFKILMFIIRMHNVQCINAFSFEYCIQFNVECCEVDKCLPFAQFFFSSLASNTMLYIDSFLCVCFVFDNDSNFHFHNFILANTQYKQFAPE